MSLTTFAEVELTADMREVSRWCLQGGIDLPASLGDAAKLAGAEGGLCIGIQSVERPADGKWVYVLCMNLASGLRLIALRSTDDDLLGQIHYDAEGWVHAEESAGRSPNVADVIRSILSSLHDEEETERQMSELYRKGAL